MNQQTSPRKQNWCLSAIIALIFGAITAFIFYYLIIFGSGDDGYAIIYCIFTAPIAMIFGLWALFYHRSNIALIAMTLCLSPLIYL
jgi:high-affinity Fe2+/Pb2+ permease